MRASDRHAGNAYDKYGSANPVARWLTARFLRELDGLVASTQARTVLDVGCGEGVVSERIAAALDADVLAVDRDEPPRLEAEWARRRSSRLRFERVHAERLPCADRAFELGCAIELLEQVDDPAACVDELARASGAYLLLSVPREPVWRWLNLARGAHWRDGGDSPATAHRFTRDEAVALAARAGDVVAVRTPLPWTLVLVRRPAAP